MIFIILQIGCESFTQLFTRHPEVMEYLGEYDSMVVDGISIGEALRYTSSSCLLAILISLCLSSTLRHSVSRQPYVTLSLVNHTLLCLLSTLSHSVSRQPYVTLSLVNHTSCHSVFRQPYVTLSFVNLISLCLSSTIRHCVSCQPYVTLSLVNLTSLCLVSTLRHSVSSQPYVTLSLINLFINLANFDTKDNSRAFKQFL